MRAMFSKKGYISGFILLADGFHTTCNDWNSTTVPDYDK
jgi:hypothetical protein